jgi:subtilase family serine protease
MKARTLPAACALSVALLGGSLFSPVAGPGSQGVSVRISPDVHAKLASRAGPVTTAQCEIAFHIACYEPFQLQAAYDETPLFSRGVDGGGQTIAVVDAFGSPTIQTDLAAFDAAFGLAAPPALDIIQPAGRVPAFDAHDAQMVDWASETTLDVEWAHAMAPGARILLVETPVAETEGAAGFKQIVKAEQYVVDHRLAGIISESFSATEETFAKLREITPLRRAFITAFHHGVTVLASSGDYGSTAPANADASLLYSNPVTTWPTSDPLVTGVGGTQLHLDTSGSRLAPDNVWNDGSNSALDETFFGNPGPFAIASGGGLSAVFGRPSYQRSASSVVGAARGVPDISMSAACDGAVDVFESFTDPSGVWNVTCGTSESTPLFAAIVALADQEAGRPLGLLNPALYAMASAGDPGIVDVTHGDNTVSFKQGGSLVTVPGFSAGPGYDLASGLGTVDAARFVPDLVAAVEGGAKTEGLGPIEHDQTGPKSTATASGQSAGSAATLARQARAPEQAAHAAVSSPGPGSRTAGAAGAGTPSVVATLAGAGDPTSPGGGGTPGTPSPDGTAPGPPTVVGACVIEDGPELEDRQD